MKFRKSIQKYGDALIIRFNKDDIANYKLQLGQKFDIDMIEVKEDGTV